MFSIITRLKTQNILNTLKNTYKSAISLDNLYPNSNQNIIQKVDFTQKNVVVDGKEQFNGYIPIEKIQITHKTCQKPGGQHVNKTQSGVEIRFHVETASWIPEWIRARLKEQQISRLTKDGYLIISSEKTRKALLNQADCLERIRAMIREASKLPRGLDEHEKLKLEISKKIADGKRLIEKRRKSEIRAFRRTSVFDASKDYYS